MGSFSGWSDWVRAPLVWLGLPDPALTQQCLAQYASEERDASHELLQAWHVVFRDSWQTSKDVIELTSDASEGIPKHYATLREAISTSCHAKDGRFPKPSALGYTLRKMRGQVRGIYRLEGRTGHADTLMWRVVSLNNGQPDCNVIGGDGGHGGDGSSPLRERVMSVDRVETSPPSPLSPPNRPGRVSMSDPDPDDEPNEFSPEALDRL